MLQRKRLEIIIAGTCNCELQMVCFSILNLFFSSFGFLIMRSPYTFLQPPAKGEKDSKGRIAEFIKSNGEFYFFSERSLKVIKPFYPKFKHESIK